MWPGAPACTTPSLTALMLPTMSALPTRAASKKTAAVPSTRAAIVALRPEEREALVGLLALFAMGPELAKHKRLRSVSVVGGLKVGPASTGSGRQTGLPHAAVIGGNAQRTNTATRGRTELGTIENRSGATQALTSLDARFLPCGEAGYPRLCSSESSDTDTQSVSSVDGERSGGESPPLFKSPKSRGKAANAGSTSALRSTSTSNRATLARPVAVPSDKQVLTARAKDLRNGVPECGICGKNFSHLGNLRRHIVSHTQDRRYNCRDCGKKFLQRSHLKTHLRIHSGEKPYGCTEHGCNKRFSQKGHLKSHMSTHMRSAAPTRAADRSPTAASTSRRRASSIYVD
jgi:DNA-directed RNA polymerase subunit RPC12/RpoP